MLPQQWPARTCGGLSSIRLRPSKSRKGTAASIFGYCKELSTKDGSHILDHSISFNHLNRTCVTILYFDNLLYTFYILYITCSQCSFLCLGIRLSLSQWQGFTTQQGVVDLLGSRVAKFWSSGLTNARSLKAFAELKVRSAHCIAQLVQSLQILLPPQTLTFLEVVLTNVWYDVLLALVSGAG